MSGDRLCVDSNIIIYTLGGRQELADRVLGCTLLLSVVAEIEALSYPGLSIAERNRVSAYVARCTVVGLGQRVKEEAIRIRSMYKLKLPDAIIAATAIALDAPLLSADKVFERLKDELLFERFIP